MLYIYLSYLFTISSQKFWRGNLYNLNTLNVADGKLIKNKGNPI